MRQDSQAANKAAASRLQTEGGNYEGTGLENFRRRSDKVASFGFALGHETTKSGQIYETNTGL